MKITFLADDSEVAQASRQDLRDAYDDVGTETADVFVVLGGDGFMLRSLHRFLHTDKLFFGLNRGAVGFLLNEFRKDDLLQRIEQAETAVLHPLQMKVKTAAGETETELAINDVSLLRQTGQTARIRVSINGVVKIENLVCDGVLLATAAGSTAYNLSAHGPILPLGAELMALTPISPFRPRRWRGAILPNKAKVRFEVLEASKRSVSATADSVEIRDAIDVQIYQNNDYSLRLLFDPHHNLEQRILNEQFEF